jgi:hypothetical protein
VTYADLVASAAIWAPLMLVIAVTKSLRVMPKSVDGQNQRHRQCCNTPYHTRREEDAFARHPIGVDRDDRREKCSRYQSNQSD